MYLLYIILKKFILLYINKCVCISVKIQKRNIRSGENVDGKRRIVSGRENVTLFVIVTVGVGTEPRVEILLYRFQRHNNITRLYIGNIFYSFKKR